MSEEDVVVDVILLGKAGEVKAGQQEGEEVPKEDTPGQEQGKEDDGSMEVEKEKGEDTAGNSTTNPVVAEATTLGPPSEERTNSTPTTTITPPAREYQPNSGEIPMPESTRGEGPTTAGALGAGLGRLGGLGGMGGLAGLAGLLSGRGGSGALGGLGGLGAPGGVDAGTNYNSINVNTSDGRLLVIKYSYVTEAKVRPSTFPLCSIFSFLLPPSYSTIPPPPSAHPSLATYLQFTQLSLSPCILALRVNAPIKGFPDFDVRFLFSLLCLIQKNPKPNFLKPYYFHFRILKFRSS
jgi:hypothetical protein